MRSLRTLVVLFLCTLYFALCTSLVHAQNEFSVDANVTYAVADSGKTQVTHDIILENNFSTLYATTYTLGLENIDAENIVAHDAKGNSIPVDIQKVAEVTSIKLNFPDAIVGKGVSRHFSISYNNGSFAVRTGEIWEVSIPRLDTNNSFRSYQVTLKIPVNFGLEAYISPKPESSQSVDLENIYTFNRSDVTQTGITAGFGQFQVFSFNLSYHLDNGIPANNPIPKNSIVEIALPPDTAYQKVYIEKIEPKPDNVRVDEDGNWLASYSLKPQERIDVLVSGHVQIFASNRPFPKPNDQVLGDNLRETQYWQVNNPQIKSLAAQLKTPKAIYDYVSTTLKYDFARVQPNVQRMGAVEALQNPDQAICMEFTDLFIAIARAAGIPAREINGYAYTENPQLQPLSLVADVLHAWPEYYDRDKGVWIPIDPTWASTSGGVDYFDKLDLRHFTFVIHGGNLINRTGSCKDANSDSCPYAAGGYKFGPNPQKDVYVSFGKLPEVTISVPNISIVPVRTLPFLNSIYSVKIGNPGPQALYSIYPTVYFDGREVSSDFVEILPPYSNYQMSINVPFSILGKGSPDIVEVSVDGSSAKIETNKTQVIINSLLAISALLIVVMIAVLIRLKKITFNRFFATITSAKQKIHDRFTKKSPKDTNSPKDLPEAS